MRHLLEMPGGAVFDASGALAAGRKRLDFLGVVVISIVTAVGGGQRLDLLLLSRHPVFWIADTTKIVVAVAAVGLTLLYAGVRVPPRNSLAVADAHGLVVLRELLPQL